MIEPVKLGFVDSQLLAGASARNERRFVFEVELKWDWLFAIKPIPRQVTLRRCTERTFQLVGKAPAQNLTRAIEPPYSRGQHLSPDTCTSAPLTPRGGSLGVCLVVLTIHPKRRPNSMGTDYEWCWEVECAIQKAGT